MLHLKFQTSEHSGPEEDFYFFMYFFYSNLEPPGAGPSWIQGPLFEQTCKGPLDMQCNIPNFKYLSKVVLKKKIFYFFSYVFLWLKTNIPVAGPSHLYTLRPWFKQLG